MKGYELTRMSQVNLHRQFLHCFSSLPNSAIIGHYSSLTMRLSIPGVKIQFLWVPVGFCTPSLPQLLGIVPQDLGELKTLTPSPWTTPLTPSMEHPMDPFHGASYGPLPWTLRLPWTIPNFLFIFLNLILDNSLLEKQ